jgi:hypothetical protein
MLWTNDCGSIDAAGDAADARSVSIHAIMPVAIGQRLLGAAPVPEYNRFAFVALPEGGMETLCPPVETYLPVSTGQNHCAEVLGITIYDSLYLALAERQDATLVTDDRRLLQAARRDERLRATGFFGWAKLP